MVARIVFLIYISFIIASAAQNLCPIGQFHKDNKCQKCDPCYNMWRDKIKPYDNNLDFSPLEQGINKIENRLHDNVLKISNLNDSKTELLSYLKSIQSMQNGTSNLNKLGAENFKYAERLKLFEKNIRYLEEDIIALEKESESKPAADNSGYIQRIDKAEDDAARASAQHKLAVNSIKVVGNVCNILKEEFNEESLKSRVSEEQQEFLALEKQYDDSFARMNAEIPCENKLCSINSTCRVCDDFTTCYKNDMLTLAANVLRNKLENLVMQVDNKSRIPSLENEMNQFQTQKELVEGVFDSIKSPEKNIIKRIDTFLSNFPSENEDIYKSILKLKANKEDAYLKKMARNISVIIAELQKILSNDISHVVNKSKTLLNTSIAVKDNIKFISETIKTVKDMLRGENDGATEENNTLKYFLLELGEIVDEIDRHYKKLLIKKRRVEDKLSKLEWLSDTAFNNISVTFDALYEAEQKSIEMQKIVTETGGRISNVVNITSELKNGNKRINDIWQRSEELASRSEDLVYKVEEILSNQYQYDQYVDKLEKEINESLGEMNIVSDTVKMTSIKYDTCR